VTAFGLTEVRVRGYRTLRDVTLRPGVMTALVGEARAGKSNVLSALWALLDPGAPAPTAGDLPEGGDGRVGIEAALADGRRISLEGEPPNLRASREGVPPVLFFPAALRAGPIVAGSASRDGGAAERLERVVRELAARPDGPSDAAGADTLVRGIEACCEEGLEGTIVLIEEPELFLRPHAQRYLFRQLRDFAGTGNQVLYSTHAPAFLNVARLEEFALVERPGGGASRIVQPLPLDPGDAFRAMSEFDAERSELFLSRAAILVEGRTESLALPFVFRSLGHDADRLAISIVECGGKSNIPLFAEICRAVGIPFVAVHDRDAPAGRRPSSAERALNALIRRVAGADRTIVLEPDFEGVSGLRSHRHKPERAWVRFQSLTAAQVPPSLRRIVELSMSLARA
jgi:hypothetical protein